MIKRIFFIAGILLLVNTQGLVQKQIVNGGTLNDTLFGIDLSYDSSMLAIGEVTHRLAGDHSGNVYFYNWENSQWNMQQKLQGNDTQINDRFGYRVSISGSYAIVGAPNFNNSAGAIYIFMQSNSQWTQINKLTAFDAASNDGFGSALKLDVTANILLVTSIAKTASSINSGAIYFYNFNNGNPTFVQLLVPTSPQPAANFGYSLSRATFANTNGKLLVGAWNEDLDAFSSNPEGAVYVFSNNGSMFTTQIRLQPAAIKPNDLFGFAVELINNIMFVGAPAPGGVGYVQIYSYNSGTWNEQQKLFASDFFSANIFGTAIAANSMANSLVIGASTAQTFGVKSGAIYYFANNGDSFGQVQKLYPNSSSAANAGDNFGNAVVYFPNGQYDYFVVASELSSSTQEQVFTFGTEVIKACSSQPQSFAISYLMIFVTILLSLFFKL